jgi:Protein of unknown function (DUF2867)
MMTLGLNWGANASETAVVMPCDALAAGACTRTDRAISIDAPPSTVFAWLCQLRVAPYSYDVLDNVGHRSPRHRTAGLRDLEVGQRFMRVFRLHSFVDAEHLTLRTKRVSVTYAVSPQHHGTRLHVRVLFDVAGLVGRIAAAGDAVMMRKQLLRLKSLAEREAAQTAPRARRTEVAEEDERLVGCRHDYADAFEVELPHTDRRTPEQAFRAALPQAPSSLRFVPLVHRLVLRFRLGPLASPDHLIGWRVVSSDTDVIHLEAEGPLMRGIIVGRRADPSTAVLTTFVVYVRRTPARIVWALVGPLHRRIVPHLLERGAAVAR